MLGVEMFPGLALGPQRLSDCYYRVSSPQSICPLVSPLDREAPAHMPLFPSSCEMAARSLPQAPPRLLHPPPTAPLESPAPPKDGVKMELENAELWKQFSSVGTEMIVTKKGRRMFPQLRVKLSGLNPSLRYILLLDIVPVDSSRYRFQDNSWQVVGGAEARLPDRIILHSLHRYQPRVHVIEARDVLMWGRTQHSFTFPETQFLTVTAYQNNKITELKINSNPFAKGFRENGMNCKKQREARLKRKNPSSQEESLDIESCDPCDSTELLPQSLASSALSIINTPLPITDSGFHPDVPSSVSDQPLVLEQAFLTSEMENQPQNNPENDNDILMNGSSQMMALSRYTSTYPAPHLNSQSNSIYSVNSSAQNPNLEPSSISSPPSIPEFSSIPSSDYPTLNSSTALPSSTTSPPSYPPQHLPSSTYHSLLPTDQSQDNLSPHTPANPAFQSIPPSSCQGSGLTIDPGQNQVDDGGLGSANATTPAIANQPQTAFPFPPVQSLNNPVVTSPQCQSLPHSALPFSQCNHVSTPSDPNTTPTAFPFPPTAQSTPNPIMFPSNPNPTDFPFSQQNPSIGLSTQTPTSGSFPDSQSSGLLSAIPNQIHPASGSYSLLSTNQAPVISLSNPLHPSTAYGVPSFPASLPKQNPTPHASYPYPTPIHSLAIPSSTPIQNVPAISNPGQIPQSYPNPSFAHIPTQSLPSQITSQSLPPIQSSQLLSQLNPPTVSHPQCPSLNAYPAVAPSEMGTFSQLNTSAAPYLPEMVLHPSLLPSLDPSLPTSSSPSLYNTFPSYSLRLCQDPRSSLHLPLRRIYRQPQHVQGSYFDLSTRAVF
ncbi:hypothetical protein DNTS_004371 [Danionella cerebrum]|uniref:T-box domain-containing protein n=1 Tax=Danionella cerebrum TaxID=2873325 RepID=A0A553P958_9TELE|nr:hypothetical protein DNTS_004371 [Danionella translucida]